MKSRKLYGSGAEIAETNDVDVAISRREREREREKESYTAFVITTMLFC